jgi:hypothetical protein
VGEQRVVLEHHADLAPVCRHVVHAFAADQDLAAVGAEESRDQVENGGLSASRRTEQGHELAAPDRQRQLVQRDHVAEPLDHAVEAHRDVGVGAGCGRRNGGVSGHVRH